MRKLAVAVLAAAVLAVGSQAQEPPKPGPEHEMLKKREGAWETTTKVGGAEFKGSVAYKMELGGLWLVGSLEGDLGGQRFYGKTLDTYDAGKKKYISVWFDNLGTIPLTLEGAYDSTKKTLTLVGQGPGLDGKETTWRPVFEMPDNDTVQMSMYVGDGKEPLATVTYKRKK